MYQSDFQDFSDFAHNAFLSTLGQSISKNHNFRFSVAMDTKLYTMQNGGTMAENHRKFTAMWQILLYNHQTFVTFTHPTTLMVPIVNFCEIFLIFNF